VGDDRGVVLDLLASADERWRTLRAEGRVWRDADLATSAFLRSVPPGSVTSRRGAPDPEGPEREDRWRLWVRQPDHARSEWDAAHGRRQVTVFAGDRPLAHDELGPAAVLVGAAPLLGEVALDVRGRTQFLGRPVHVVHGTPRSGERRPGPAAHRLGRGADEYELLVDAERGVLLRSEARIDGDPFLIVEATAVAFDEDLPDALFAPAADAAGPAPPAPPPAQARPPAGVLGQPATLQVVLVRTERLLVAATGFVAYPTGFEFTLTVRQAGPTTTPPPGPSLRVGLGYSPFRPDPARAPVVTPLGGSGDGHRFDLRHWVEPLPPRGRLTFELAWPDRGVAPTRVVVEGGPLVDAAARAQPIWPEGPG
jgi:hypothetical protein